MPPVSQTAQIVPLTDSTYQEALALTHEARSFIEARRGERGATCSPAESLRISCEIMRLTSRLTQVMAWLMVQKAVHAGEISREDAHEPNCRLSGHDVCGAQDPDLVIDLTPTLVDLLDRSLRLYQRVARLDAMHDDTPD